MESAGQNQEPWFLKSKFPVFFPSHPALNMSANEFDKFLIAEMDNARCHGYSRLVIPEASHSDEKTATDTDTFIVVSSSAVSATADVRDKVEKLVVDAEQASINGAASPKPENQHPHPFMQGLLSPNITSTLPPSPKGMENKMFTRRSGLAYRSTTSDLVDLFAELEDVVSGPRLLELLNAAWGCDPLVTLKIIFNARSIHLGKGSRHTFYRCAGWLARYHPLTLVVNLPWLSRPVIQKKVKKEEADDLVLVDSGKSENDPTRFDVRNGVAHGYWKDLLNLLALHVNGMLDVLAQPRDILNIEQEKGKHLDFDQTIAKELRHKKRDTRHETAIAAFNNDAVYRALHLAVARLFASELKSDLARLRSEDAESQRGICLCAKCTPSLERFHDKHTFIVSTIAELMHPVSEFNTVLSTYEDKDKEQREVYLRYARDAYRKDISSLRKHLKVVEREITSKTYQNVEYEKIPSIAMNNYTRLFEEKDSDRFADYLSRVATGKAQISGATLLPSTLIKAVRKRPTTMRSKYEDVKSKDNCEIVDHKLDQMNTKVVDGQWKSLVQRIRNSGSLQSSIAVADVSRSMLRPIFPDGTCPMDTSIGLSLLLAEVTKPPFDGAFITFSRSPNAQKIDLSKSLMGKYRELDKEKWTMNTNLVAVFDTVILPMAIKNKLKQKDMVKQIFVISDMQFDKVKHDETWSTSYEHVKGNFEQAGYEMPQLIFWNLAGRRAGYDGLDSGGDPMAPKPVTTTDEGTAIVSGYSQGMLKVFLEDGTFEADDEEQVAAADATNDENPRKKQKLDPLNIVKKAIGHKAYDMLKVVD